MFYITSNEKNYLQHSKQKVTNLDSKTFRNRSRQCKFHKVNYIHDARPNFY